MSETKKVYEAINKITAALAKVGIEKGHRNEDQKFDFRGIDDVLNAVAPLLAEHKLCILPSIVGREVTPRKTKSGGDTYNVAVKVEYAFVSAEDGSTHIVATPGEANDTQDKATNKAMSAAYKYACFQAFCIPVDVPDADAGGDGIPDDDLTAALKAIDEAGDVTKAKKVYKDFVSVATKVGDTAAANKVKAKLLDLYPEAGKKAA